MITAGSRPIRQDDWPSDNPFEWTLADDPFPCVFFRVGAAVLSDGMVDRTPI